MRKIQVVMIKAEFLMLKDFNEINL